MTTQAKSHPLPRTFRHDELRRRIILVEHDPDPSALKILLRIAEDTTTHVKLRALGFDPTSAPDASAISWRKPVPEGELESVGRALVAALGRDSVVLDLGAHFGEASVQLDPPRWWSGKLLLHVGGTTRCVVFDEGVPLTDLDRMVVSQRRAYEEQEYHPPTE
jgi:hypothetical protein